MGIALGVVGLMRVRVRVGMPHTVQNSLRFLRKLLLLSLFQLGSSRDWVRLGEIGQDWAREFVIANKMKLSSVTQLPPFTYVP